MAQKNKTVENDNSVTAFLDTIADEKRKEDAYQIYHLMNSLLPEEAKMWGSSLVGYGTYHYRYDSGREGDFFKVGFSPRKQNLTVYIIPGFEKYDSLMAHLGNYKTGKSCLYIKKWEDINEQILIELINESYSYMTEKYG